MTYVIDTHALFWRLTNSRKLSRRVKAILDEAESEAATVFIPVIVLAELQFIYERDNLFSLAEALQQIDQFPGFQIVDMTRSHAERLHDLRKVPEMHDRAIVAAALELDAKVLTTDPAIENSGLVKTVWL